MDNEYEIGYGKPPRANQFAKGQSGNPKGRPKGTRNFASMFREIAQEEIQLKENGRTRVVTKLGAIMLQIVNKGVSGDLRAAKEVIQWNRAVEESVAQDAVDHPDRPKDDIVMRALQQRLLARAAVQHSQVGGEETADGTDASGD